MKYKLFAINGVTEEEYSNWTQESKRLGYRTRTAFIKELLKKYKHKGYSEDFGKRRISVSDFEPTDKMKVKNRSKSIRYYINKRITNGKY